MLLVLPYDTVLLCVCLRFVLLGIIYYILLTCTKIIIVTSCNVLLLDLNKLRDGDCSIRVYWSIDINFPYACFSYVIFLISYLLYVYA